VGVAYVAALVAALGILLVQVFAGSHGGHHGDLGHGHAGHDQSGSQHAHGATHDESALWTLFLSLRFWLFAALGFGLSGTLLHAFSSAPPLTTLLVASVAGLGSGLFAALAFRVLGRGSASTEARSSAAVGKVGRVVVPCGRGVTGQVRIEIAGSSVDLMATTDDEGIARGEEVLVEDLDDGVARVSRKPGVLG
jgi:membrane protein implicated in regulation of membrane protease activity